MIDLVSPTIGRTCAGVTRRDLLRIGTFGLGGLTLPTLLRAAEAAREGGGYVRDRAIVLLFLAGGPSQYETFDPKPGGLAGSTSLKGHVPTKLPGVRFSAYLPKLADRADKLSIVRSFQVKHGEHNAAHKQLLTGDLTVQDGKPITEPGIGAVYARIAGAMNEKSGMVRHALLPPTSRYLPKSGGFAGSYESVVEGCMPADLGAAYAPFTFHVPMKEGSEHQKKRKPGDRSETTLGGLLDDLQPRLPLARLQDRADLLRQIDRLDRAVDAGGMMDGLDRYHRQALDLLRGDAVRKALDLSREDVRTVAAYDTEHFRNWNCDENSKFVRSGPSIGFSLGRQLLMARRLCEAGCGFVTVINANWDFHARKNIPNMPEGMDVFGPPLDHAVSAFLDDVEARGLSDKILLVITGEFGRTPGLDKNQGRHHWPRICPLVFAGGGLRHGQVIGESDRRGGEPAGKPITIADFQATLLNALFDLGKVRLDASLPRKILTRAATGTPIGELF